MNYIQFKIHPLTHSASTTDKSLIKYMAPKLPRVTINKWKGQNSCFKIFWNLTIFKAKMFRLRGNGGNWLSYFISSLTDVSVYMSDILFTYPLKYRFGKIHQPTR